MPGLRDTEAKAAAALHRLTVARDTLEREEARARERIAEEVWDMNFDSDTNVVDVHVRRLRSKLDDPYEKKLIQTVRGVGYVSTPGPPPGRSGD